MVELFHIGCAQDSPRYPKTRKCSFGPGSAHATKFRNFSR